MIPNVIILDDLIQLQMNFKWKSNILVKNWILTYQEYKTNTVPIQHSLWPSV